MSWMQSRKRSRVLVNEAIVMFANTQSSPVPGREIDPVLVWFLAPKSQIPQSLCYQVFPGLI